MVADAKVAEEAAAASAVRVMQEGGRRDAAEIGAVVLWCCGAVVLWCCEATEAGVLTPSTHVSVGAGAGAGV